MPPHNPKNVTAPIMASPFFKPSSPRVVKSLNTPGGTFVRFEKKEVDHEAKASAFGTTSNLVNAIVGAGIVGIPFAIKQSGLVAGVFMVLLCAYLTDKSLKMLIFTAKHVGVPTYELLSEASFGKAGFYFISLNMFIMSYGAMISYLMIVKDTLPLILGFEADNYPMKRSLLVVSSFLVMFPLSCQRDMAHLAKTSTISALFDCFMIGIIAMTAPISTRVPDLQHLNQFVRSSIIHPSTLFIGLGVLSFAYVCQHSAFIIAGSLEKPTRKRWGCVTSLSLSLCALLATTCGVYGYLGFGDNTVGNILNNFPNDRPSNIARALLCFTMFFVYPMESFVSRHVLVVTFFQGRRAHEGDDHAVLARTDRRIGVTLSLYICALIPAVLFEDLGSVLSFSGALGGSCLSYIGPGAMYLAVHGEAFLDIVAKKWPGIWKTTSPSNVDENIELANVAADSSGSTKSVFFSILNTVNWYICLMPIWCNIATLGKDTLKSFQETEALKSPHVSRIGKYVYHQNSSCSKKQTQRNKCLSNERDDDDDLEDIKPLTRAGSFSSVPSSKNKESSTLFDLPPTRKHPRSKQHIAPFAYGSTSATSTMKGNQGIGAAILAQKKIQRSVYSSRNSEENVAEEDLEAEPSLFAFLEAIGFIIFGVIALVAGLVSGIYKVYAQQNQ